MDDNRRRISKNLLEEIEQFDGKDFSEQLLKWKNDSDSSSIDIDTLSHDDIDDAVSEALRRELPEILEQVMR